MGVPLYLADLMTGLFAELARRDIRELDMSGFRFDRALGQLVPDAQELGFTLKFRIRPHEIHGDSESVQRGLYEAVQSGLIRRYGYSSIEIRIPKDEAEGYFASLPGERALYTILTEKLLGYLR